MRAFLEALVEFPNEAQTLLVEIIGAGPAAARRRDEILERFARVVDRENERMAKNADFPRFASPDDAFAIVGAIVELASRQVRLRQPAHPLDLQPVIEELDPGLEEAAASLGATRGQVLAVQALEYALLALVLGAVALALGSAGGWYVVTQLFGLDWLPDWGVILATLAVGAIATIGIGLRSGSRWAQR